MRIVEDQDAAALVVRAKRLQLEGNTTSWALADTYRALQVEFGWSGRRIAVECEVSQSHVSRFLRCASESLGTQRGSFWETYQRIKEPDLDLEAKFASLPEPEVEPEAEELESEPEPVVDLRAENAEREERPKRREARIFGYFQDEQSRIETLVTGALGMPRPAQDRFWEVASKMIFELERLKPKETA